MSADICGGGMRDEPKKSMSLLEDGTVTVEEGLPSFDVTLFMCDMRKMYA